MPAQLAPPIAQLDTRLGTLPQPIFVFNTLL